MQAVEKPDEYNNDGSVNVVASIIYNGAPQAVNVLIISVTKHHRFRFPLRERQNIISRYYNEPIYAGVFWNTPAWKLDEAFALKLEGPYYEWDTFIAMLQNRHW